MTETRRIDDIVVGPRFRKDFGDIAGLAASIHDLGLLQPPGVTPDGRLLWGECRLRACRQLGWTEIPILVRDVDPGDFVAVEAAENFARKDFTLSEAVAIKRAVEEEERRLAKERMSEGGRGAKLAPPDTGKARDKIAVRTGVGRTSLAKAEAVVDVARAEPERFGGLLADMDRTGKADRAFKALKVARTREAYEARCEQGGTVADLERLAASGFRAAAILDDSPWLYRAYSDKGNLWTSAANHYTPRTIEELCSFGARYVLPLAAPDCALFSFTTWPLVATGEFHAVVRAWGFEPKTLAFLWEKLNPRELDEEDFFMGNGFWTRANTEPCFIATRGNPLRLDAGVEQIIRAPVGKHSAKPDEVHTRIMRLVAGPYIELHARRHWPGWYCWGNEVPQQQAAAE